MNKRNKTESSYSISRVITLLPCAFSSPVTISCLVHMRSTILNVRFELAFTWLLMLNSNVCISFVWFYRYTFSLCCPSIKSSFAMSRIWKLSMACQTLHYSIFLYIYSIFFIAFAYFYICIQFLFIAIVYVSFLFYIRSFVFNICSFLLYMFRFCSIFDQFYLIINDLYAMVFHYYSITSIYIQNFSFVFCIYYICIV